METLRTLFPASNFALLAVILGLPLLGAFVNGVFGKRLGKEGVRAMALTAIGGAFAFSVVTFLLLPGAAEGGAAERLTWVAWRWFSLTGRMGQSIPIDIAFSVDAMTATMMLVVTGIGFLIHLYSCEYMRDDPGFARYFAYLNLFIFAMLVLITGDNLAVLFVGWEGVGLCSYLLIGFWFSEEKNAAAGKKAFILNRIGDFGLILAIAMLVYYVGSLSWTGIESNAAALLTPVKIWPIGNLSAETLPAFVAKVLIPAKPVQVYASTLVGLALFLGCAGKSAQLPLYVWLPDAMAGPTPVSALIHAATMVTAGVYLVARLSFVFVLSPAAMATVAIVGAATALFAASIGLVQTDLKKVLAYSTVSQLGFMFIGVGVGAFSAGLFHVITHAFFKACLFLGAGSVIHAMHARIHDGAKSQDLRNMGGLGRYMPVTRWTFLISCFAIAGLPPFAGFWSKDEILWKAFSTMPLVPPALKSVPIWQWPANLGPVIYVVGILAATMTSFYMFRAYFMTFHGTFRGWDIVKGWKAPASHGHDDAAEHQAHADDVSLEGPTPRESPWAMTLPLIVLATGATFAGFLMAEPIHLAPLAHLLEPVFAHSSRALSEREGVTGMMLPMMLPGLAAFLAGTGAAMYVYLNRGGEPERAFAAKAPGVYQLLVDKWRVDELYDATVVGMVDALADIFTMADKWIIDGVLVRLTSGVVSLSGTVLRAFHTGRMQVSAAAMVLGLLGIGWFVVQPHADATIDESKLKDSGQVLLAAAPGLGYSFLWEGPGIPPAKDYSPVNQLSVRLDAGEKKAIVLHVRNAFERETTTTIALARPGTRRSTDATRIQIPEVRPLPKGPVPGEKIQDLLKPGGFQ